MESDREYRETYIFQTIQVLVSLVTVFTLVWLLLLHSSFTGIRRRCLGIDDGKGAVSIFMQLLVLMTVLLVVPALSVSDITGIRAVKRYIKALLTSIHFGSYRPSHTQLPGT